MCIYIHTTYIYTYNHPQKVQLTGVWIEKHNFFFQRSAEIWGSSQVRCGKLEIDSLDLFVKALFLETSPLKASFEARKRFPILPHSKHFALQERILHLSPHSVQLSPISWSLLELKGQSAWICLHSRSNVNNSFHLPHDGNIWKWRCCSPKVSTDLNRSFIDSSKESSLRTVYHTLERVTFLFFRFH